MIGAGVALSLVLAALAGACFYRAIQVTLDLRRARRATAIPGKYPWTISAENPPPYGLPLFEDANFKHYADGAGGVVSARKARPKPVRREARQARGKRAF